jgi:peptidyl-prolyl cis-trans isomerase SurA
MKIQYILCLGLVLALPRVQAQSELANGILVVVNNDVITMKDVENSVAPAISLLMRQYEKQPDVLKEKIYALERERVEELVANQLILHDFTNSGYNLPESYIEDRVQERIRLDYYGDRAKLMKTLQEEGVTFERFRKRIRENIIIGALREKHLSQELLISPHKIETYYQTNQTQFQLGDQVKLRMIVLNKSKEAPETAGKLAQEILGKLTTGASFAEMASVYSDASPSVRAAGGDWGWVERTVLNKDLADVAFTLKPGQHSGVVDTSAACYIMLVEESRSAHTRPLSEVREEIEKILLAKEQDRLQKKWIERLKNKSFVRYFQSF